MIPEIGKIYLCQVANKYSKVQSNKQMTVKIISRSIGYVGIEVKTGLQVRVDNSNNIIKEIVA